MAKKHKIIRESSALLGQNIQRMRIAKDMSRKEIAKIIKKSEQQIAKYESGEFVPLPVMEDLAKAMGEQIPKKIIRRISFIRKSETEFETQMEEELSELYNEAFPEPYDEEYE